MRGNNLPVSQPLKHLFGQQTLFGRCISSSPSSLTSLTSPSSLSSPLLPSPSPSSPRRFTLFWFYHVMLILKIGTTKVTFGCLKKTLFWCHHGMLFLKTKIDIDIDKSDIVWPIIDNTGSRLKAIIWCSVLDWTCCWTISVLMAMMMIVFLFPYICDDNHHL